ncbi:MAG TPA: (2Fe-2S)-binding protein [Prosthecochloris aestuarii]|uniref:(2Fe-2S)-binding protein n=1 Tax=Prosthecochloris aestuarii TaxID=1102 RepID=A0A831SSF8_PROAE|nr:(2Fe-2S)-binding protein [Prosthecochloris sp.]HED31769.1 (2Fe-2S)-binding protein [Prosthecochloris aestuarii]
MKIYVNDKACEASPGDLLLDVAQQNKCHIGYICGGSGICQSCFVYVQEGMEFLSSPTDIERAFISDKLSEAGGRLACQTKITGEGTVKVLSRAEHLRRIVVGLNLPDFITYAQTIGYNVTNKLPSGAGNIFERAREGKLNPAQSLQNIGKGLGHASLFASSTFMETFSFLQGPVSMISGGARAVFDTASDAVCNLSGGRLHLPGATCRTCNDEPALERVQITARSVREI